MVQIKRTDRTTLTGELVRAIRDEEGILHLNITPLPLPGSRYSKPATWTAEGITKLVAELTGIRRIMFPEYVEATTSTIEMEQHRGDPARGQPQQETSCGRCCE